MSTSQLLLRRLLDQAGGSEESGYLLVLRGEGLESLPKEIPTSHGTYAVERADTEIRLRFLLWKAQGAPLIVVLPDDLANRLPPDLLRRARNRRVHLLAINDVLEVVLGVRVVGADSPHLRDLALAHLDTLGQLLIRRTVPTVIDRKLLTELLVDASVGERVRQCAPAELLASWVLEPPQWSENVRLLVSQALPTMHGDEGRLLAWALEGPDNLRALIVHGAVLTVEADEVPQQAWGPLWRAAAREPAAMDRRIFRRAVIGLVEGALERLGEQAGPLLQEADRLGRATLTPSQLQHSRVLPLAFSSRCHALAQQAARGKAIAAREITWLEQHRAAPLNGPEVAALAAMARLTRYLDKPRSRARKTVALVESYLQEGAFADLAALDLRRALAESPKHHTEANTVLDAYRAQRDADNLAFAESLAADYPKALHRKELVPLHRLWKRVVADLWSREPDARLYLVVLDGCSYPVFLEMVYQLAQDGGFPIGLSPGEDGSVRGLAALAPLPTVTSHARGAIFLGELPQDPLVAETVFRDGEAKTDRARLKQNAALKGRTSELFLKGDLADHGGRLLKCLRGTNVDVVAAVFNAVDDQIESKNTGVTLRLNVRDVVALKPSLRAAIESGRRVLVTADHGHSLYVNKELRVGKAVSSRYLSLADGASVPEGFIEIDLAGLGGAPERRAFAWRSGVYLGQSQVGFHGGCSLEEMVVPLAWLRRDGLQAQEPSWWYGQGTLPDAPKALPPVTPPLTTPHPSPHPPAKTTAKVSPGAAEGAAATVAAALQFDLFKPGQKAHLLALPEAVLTALSEDERAVLVLLRENGSARATELATRLGKNPGRLNGLMRKLNRALHQEGLTLFTSETLPNGETLYRYQAREQAR